MTGKPVTFQELAKIIGRHRTVVDRAVKKYRLPMIGVRVDGHHLQHALSAKDAETFLALRQADGFRAKVMS